MEIDNRRRHDTRDQLISFVDHVRRRDSKTIAGRRLGLTDCATILIANHPSRPRVGRVPKLDDVRA